MMATLLRRAAVPVIAPPPTEADASKLAHLARAFELKLHRLLDETDSAWIDRFMGAWGFLKDMPLGPARVALLRRLLADQCGGLPNLQRLTDRWARLALLPRAELLGSLCALALARRPGVLRCCLDLDTRQDIKATLGNRFSALMALSHGGRPPSRVATLWSGMHWACIGYADWITQMQSTDGALRRMVRLSLDPDTLLKVGHTTEAPADLETPKALQALVQAGVDWPC